MTLHRQRPRVHRVGGRARGREKEISSAFKRHGLTLDDVLHSRCLRIPYVKKRQAASELDESLRVKDDLVLAAFAVSA